jgi:hypothetical protein
MRTAAVAGACVLSFAAGAVFVIVGIALYLDDIEREIDDLTGGGR